MKNWLQRLMIGRYGVDQLSNAALGIGVVFILISVLTDMYIFNIIGLVIFVFSYFRIFSKNINKRYQENQKFLGFFKQIKNKLSRVKNRTKATKDFKYFKCPTCNKEMRVPRGKGRINITCPKCKTVFIRRT